MCASIAHIIFLFYADQIYHMVDGAKYITVYFRCCIVGCYLTEDSFLAKEGVFLLLDLLEVSFS